MDKLEDKHGANDTMSVRRKVEEALGTFLPAMQADGGGVVFDRFEDKTVHLQFKGACRFCPSQELTIKETLLPALRAKLAAEIKIVIE